jgi:hypothetical protein
MTFKIATFERAETKTGKVKANTTLTDERGTSHYKVSIWSDFPNFSSLEVGSMVEGDLVPAKDPKYGPTLYPAKTYNTFKKNPAVAERLMDKKESSIERFQNTKEESIAKAQDNKEHSIMVASTASQATQILTSMIEKSGLTLEANDWHEQWLKIRYFLVKNWSNTEPFKVGNTDINYPENNLEDSPF